MASKTLNIPEFPVGWYMSWDMYTMAANKITVTLTDNNQTSYVAKTSAGGNSAFTPLAQGFSKVNAAGLKITIDIPQSDAIEFGVISKQSVVPTSGSMAGSPVGYSCVLSLEDAGDQDYNDLVVTLMCWKSNH